MSKKFSHLDDNNNPSMVDISSKLESKRIAKAYAKVILNNEILNLISENKIRKGNVLEVANIAGIQAAKKTHELIPLCHNINLSSININFKTITKNSSVEVNSIVKSSYKTGVEMEALTACSIACLTIYDMCKSFDKEIIINKLRLKYKSGGKSGEYKNDKIYKST